MSVIEGQPSRIQHKKIETPSDISSGKQATSGRVLTTMYIAGIFKENGINLDEYGSITDIPDWEKQVRGAFRRHVVSLRSGTLTKENDIVQEDNSPVVESMKRLNDYFTNNLSDAKLSAVAVKRKYDERGTYDKVCDEDDLVQIVAEKCCKKAQKGEIRDDNIGGLVYRASANAFMDVSRPRRLTHRYAKEMSLSAAPRQGTRRRLDVESIESGENEIGYINITKPRETENIVIAHFEAEEMGKAILTLPEAQRLPIILAYYKNMNQREVAKTLDMPLGTIKTRTRLAIQKLHIYFNGKAGHEALRA